MKKRSKKVSYVLETLSLQSDSSLGNVYALPPQIFYVQQLDHDNMLKGRRGSLTLVNSSLVQECSIPLIHIKFSHVHGSVVIVLFVEPFTLFKSNLNLFLKQ